MEAQTSYLNFYKTILEKVKFDKQLFWKEYNKAIKQLSIRERMALDHWINSQYRN